MTLDDDGNDNVFDQFKGKKTSYKDDIYTTKIDKTKITRDIENIA